MATSQSTIDFILDQLASLPSVRARKMFGEYGLYCDEKLVGLVCDNQLFVKITPAGKALVGERYAEGEPYPGAKPSLVVSADDLENEGRLSELIRVTAAGLLPPKRKAAAKAKRE